MNDELTTRQQAFVDKVSDKCDETVGSCIDAGLLAMCPECQNNLGQSGYELQESIDRDNVVNEGSFSWTPCDICGSTFGGDRYVAHGIVKDYEDTRVIEHYDICGDCLLYLDAGDVPSDESLA